MEVFSEFEKRMIERIATIDYEKGRQNNPYNIPEARTIWRCKFEKLQRDERSKKAKLRKANKRR